ncbi:TetR/AcrR family transcriptional regulator [Salinispora mooreana]|uniref:TetR/AcrR family transcriptional regulator n=1 Tax=Salinispora mooreana TaxID=999545 RepID=UPI00036B5538|nr:TetR-like C-terminal domain-containing protein [Salinispora mooreana]
MEPDIASTETVERIKQTAHRHLVEQGPAGLEAGTLALAAGLTVEQLRTHFPDRADLLTAMVLDAYNAMGDGAENGARQSGGSPLDRWVAACRAIRIWAQADAERYALIWGPPIAGYSAPPETMVAGARAAQVLIGLLREAAESGQLRDHPQDPPMSEGMSRNVAALGEGMLSGLPPAVIARMLVAWTQLLGMVSFAAYGHVQGFAADPDAFFDHAAAAMGHYVGLPR